MALLSCTKVENLYFEYGRRTGGGLDFYLTRLVFLNFYVHLQKKKLKRESISKMADEALLNYYRDSENADYFGELYNRYIPLLYGIGLKYLTRPEIAEDAVMDLFEILLPKVAQYDIKQFRTWIFSVMKNHCLQTLRKENHEITVDFNSEIMESDEILNLFEEEEDNARKKALKLCMNKLPDEQRTVIIRFFMENMSYRDITENTLFTLNQVKSFIQNGKRNLKLCIEKNSR